MKLMKSNEKSVIARKNWSDDSSMIACEIWSDDLSAIAARLGPTNWAWSLARLEATGWLCLPARLRRATRLAWSLARFEATNLALLLTSNKRSQAYYYVGIYMCISANIMNFDNAFGSARELCFIKMPTRGIVKIWAGYRHTRSFPSCIQKACFGGTSLWFSWLECLRDYLRGSRRSCLRQRLNDPNCMRSQYGNFFSVSLGCSIAVWSYSFMSVGSRIRSMTFSCNRANDWKPIHLNKENKTHKNLLDCFTQDTNLEAHESVWRNSSPVQRCTRFSW